MEPQPQGQGDGSSVHSLPLQRASGVRKDGGGGWGLMERVCRSPTAAQWEKKGEKNIFFEEAGGANAAGSCGK